MAKLTGRSLRLSEPVGAAALLLLGVACPLILMAQPRAVPPRELPSLTLEADDVQTVIADDTALAAKAPDSQHAQQLRALLDAQGEAEQKPLEDLGRYKQRRDALKAACEAVVEAAGSEAALALRAQAVRRFDDALELRLPPQERDPVMGALPSILAREGVTRDGYLVAPAFVARTLYKARWNILCGLSPDHAFERVERRAFHGWQALHSERLPLQQRIDALDVYKRTGGKHADEALGGLLYRGRAYERALDAYAQARTSTASLRLRNHGLASALAAENARREAEPSTAPGTFSPQPD